MHVCLGNFLATGSAGGAIPPTNTGILFNGILFAFNGTTITYNEP